MSTEQLNINYTKEAFLNPINLGVLLVSTIGALYISNVSGELGISLSNLLLTTVFGIELVYLGVIPKLPRFRKNIEHKKIIIYIYLYHNPVHRWDFHTQPL